MKFEVTNIENPAIRISLVQARDGEVAVCANGIEILWVQPDGSLLRNGSNSEELKKMGFKINSDGRVALYLEQ